MDQWEYTVDDVVVPLKSGRHDLAAALNEHAATGWELVALTGLAGSSSGLVSYRGVFKRPKLERSRVVSPTPVMTAG